MKKSECCQAPVAKEINTVSGGHTESIYTCKNCGNYCKLLINKMDNINEG